MVIVLSLFFSLFLSSSFLSEFSSLITFSSFIRVIELVLLIRGTLPFFISLFPNKSSLPNKLLL